METQTERQIHEVQVLYKRPALNTLHKVRSSCDIVENLRAFIDPMRIDLKEFFFVVLLSKSNHILGIAEISSGTIDGTVVNTKEIFQLVILCNAPHLILAHNHPSGNLEPSVQDIAITKRLVSAAGLLEVKILDHIILTSEGYYSMSDERVLPSS